ncbi:hypothetical protein QYF61_010346 [Mycteria americana]|uniref:Uncharacterized protein n=1 Tax=Mycteria americana TaxID=33587 RepID=A0AAN7MR47_MYCAM|nr:hypothetical protein QYF61_010346 [Mycteria americana]
MIISFWLAAGFWKRAGALQKEEEVAFLATVQKKKWSLSSLERPQKWEVTEEGREEMCFRKADTRSLSRKFTHMEQGTRGELSSRSESAQCLAQGEEALRQAIIHEQPADSYGEKGAREPTLLMWDSKAHPSSGHSQEGCGCREGEPGFGARPAPREAYRGAEGFSGSESAMVDVSNSWSAVRLELASKFESRWKPFLTSKSLYLLMDRPFRRELEKVLWFHKLPFGLQSSDTVQLESLPWMGSLERCRGDGNAAEHQGKSGLTGWHAFEKRSSFVMVVMGEFSLLLPHCSFFHSRSCLDPLPGTKAGLETGVWGAGVRGKCWCIVVSNGFIHGQRFGKMIDSHHVIIRLNDAPVKKHKKYVGERTSIHLFFPESALPNPLEDNDNDTLVVFVPSKPLDFLWLREVLVKTRNKKDPSLSHIGDRYKVGFWCQPPQEWNGNVSQLGILDPYVTYEATYKLLQLNVSSSV